MTRLLIVSDMEGVAGLTRYEQCVRGHEEYQTGVELACDELDVIARVAFERGASSVSVIDWHGGGDNLQPDLLDDRVQIVPEDLSPGYDLAMLVGFHPMAGDTGGFISHTMFQGVAVEVNGRHVGEIALITWWLGEHGIPVGLVTGDRAATAEADRFFPDVPCHTVKQAESWSRAICIPVETSNTALRDRAARVMEQPGRWVTARPEAPLSIRLLVRDEIPVAGSIPWLERQEGGWLAGELAESRDVIDVLDVIASLRGAQAKDEEIERLSQLPGAEDVRQRLMRDRIARTIDRGDWSIQDAGHAG